MWRGERMGETCQSMSMVLWYDYCGQSKHDPGREIITFSRVV